MHLIGTTKKMTK